MSSATTGPQVFTWFCDLCQEEHTALLCDHGFIVGHCTQCKRAKS